MLVAIPYAAGSFLGTRIHDRAWFAWHPARRADYMDWVGESFRKSLIKAAVVTLVLGVLTWWAQQDGDGSPLAAISQLAFYASLVVLLWRAVLLVRRNRLARTGGSSLARLPITPTLWVARRTRTTRLLTAIYHLMSERIVPIVVTLLVIAAVFFAALHVVYIGEQVAGAFCNGVAARPADVSSDGRTQTQAGFAASQVCWSTGAFVKTGRRYRAELQIADGDAWWFDRTQRTDPAGFAGTEPKHLAAAVLKRSWSAPWFAPILRVGSYGLDEFTMKPLCEGDADCDPVAYAKTPEPPALPIFAPIPADLAQRLVNDSPHPEAPRKAVIEFVAAHDGEVHLFVNDALLPWPTEGGPWPFYKNNTGGGPASRSSTSRSNQSQR